MSTMRPRSRSKAFRAPDPELASMFGERIGALLAHAEVAGLTSYLITFSSRCFGPVDVVLDHVKKAWAKLQQKSVWRDVVGAVWVFADHEHPHVHCVVSLPPTLRPYRLKDAWSAGYGHVRPVFGDAPRLGAYFAAQRSDSAARAAKRRRFHGHRCSQRLGVLCTKTSTSRTFSIAEEHLLEGSAESLAEGRRLVSGLLAPRDLASATSASKSVSIDGTAVTRAEAGGETAEAKATGEGRRDTPSERRRPSGDERESPEGERVDAGPEADGLVEAGSPPRGSEGAFLSRPIAPASIVNAHHSPTATNGAELMMNRQNRPTKNRSQWKRPNSATPTRSADASVIENSSALPVPAMEPQALLPHTRPMTSAFTLPLPLSAATAAVDQPTPTTESPDATLATPQRGQAVFVPPKVTAADAHHWSCRRAFAQQVKSARAAIKLVVRHGKNCKRSGAEILRLADVDSDVGFAALSELVMDGVLEVFVDRANVELERWFWARSQADLVDISLW